MGALFALLRGWLGSLIGSVAVLATGQAAGTVAGITVAGVLWGVVQTFFKAVGTALIAYTLYRLYIFILVRVTMYAFSKLEAVNWGNNLALQLTGFGGWIATQLNLQGCFAIMLSALSVRFILSFLRR